MEKEIYSKELKKEAWQQMSSILDHEMPVKKRRWFPIFLIIFVLSSIGIGYSLNKNTTTNNISNLDSEINLKSNNLNNKKDQFTKSTIPLNNNDKYIKNTNQENNKIDTSTFNNQKIKKIKSSQNSINYNSKKYNTIASLETQKQDSKVKTFHTKVASIENKTKLISGLNTKTINVNGAKDLILFPKLSLDYIDLSNRTLKIFNPYIELKTYLHNYKEFNPKFGIALGNRFELSNKFFLSLECSFVQPEIIIQSKNIIFDQLSNSKSYAIEKNSSFSFNSDGGLLKTGVFELSVYEGFKFNNNLNMQVGAGIAFTNKLNNYLTDTINYELNDALNGGESIDLSEYNNSFKIKKHTWFADLSVSYSALKNFRVNLGYKYYFKNHYILTQDNSDLYRQEIINTVGQTGIYLGLQYSF